MAPDDEAPLYESSFIQVPPAVHGALSAQRANVIAGIERRNVTLFADESEKLDAWADDLKLGLEREIKELDRRIKETRTKSKGAATLAEKLEAQKEQRNLEAQRDKRRRDLFARQDEIEARRSRLIDDLERLLGQSVEEQVLVCCEWELT